jgi:hypothetical protein
MSVSFPTKCFWFLLFHKFIPPSSRNIHFLTLKMFISLRESFKVWRHWLGTRNNITRPEPLTSEHYRVIKKLVWILQVDQKVSINIRGWSKSWYEYYRVIKKLVWILHGDQKVGMNITGWSKSWYVYYGVIKKLV